MTDQNVNSRREFMKTAGKFAAYTPPLMLGLMYPGEHAIASGGKVAGGGHVSNTISHSSSRSRSSVVGSSGGNNRNRFVEFLRDFFRGFRG